MEKIIKIDMDKLSDLIFCPDILNNDDYNPMMGALLKVGVLNEDEYVCLVYEIHENLSDKNKEILNMIYWIDKELIAPDYITEESIDEQYIKLKQYMNNDIETIFKNMPYQLFLISPYWKIIRNYKKLITGNKCQLCSNTKYLHVHHNNYKNKGLEYKNLDDLIVLCNVCHAKFHNKI